MVDNKDEKIGKITLSALTKTLLKTLEAIKPKKPPHQFSTVSVSRTASFLAIVYEKIRNAIEYREEHLLRRAAIERILKRRFSLNPQGTDEAENLLKELLWARYFSEDSMGEEDVKTIQTIIDRYIFLKNLIQQNKDASTRNYLEQFILDLVTCEIEETLTPAEAATEAAFTYYIFQTLHQKIKIEGMSEDQKDAHFLVSIDQTYRKSDNPYLRYHLFITSYEPLFQNDTKKLSTMYEKLPALFKKIDSLIRNPLNVKLSRFVKRQLPAFLILFELIKKNPTEIKEICSQKELLWNQVNTIAQEKYQDAQKRLRGLAVRSLIYIFITKMLLALILEYPVSLYFYDEVNLVSIVINTLFPPLLMITIVLLLKLPSPENTVKIYKRIVGIIDEDPAYETQVAYITKTTKEKRPLLVFFFTIFYSGTFFLTLWLIHEGLNLLNFNLISQTIFIFFVSVITFFSNRIKQVSDEYKIEEKEGVIAPFIDFFFLPIISIGKFLSAELGKINIFIVLFDVIIETPFKLVVEIFEEWIRFIKARKEEIG